jgi:RNA polymerase sigma factor (sigma-70 family)
MDLSAAIDDISLAALKRDCRRTQERIYRAFSPAAWTLAVRICGCEAQAWDAVQSGFVRAFEKAGQLRQPERFGPWLRRIIVNQVMDSHRQRFEALPDTQELAEESPSSPADVLDLEQALSRLDLADRSVLLLHDAEGLTHVEIAEMAGQSVSWSKSRLSRARARMRHFLDTEPAIPAGRTASHAS